MPLEENSSLGPRAVPHELGICWRAIINFVLLLLLQRNTLESAAGIFFSALLCNRFGSQRGARLVVSLQKLTTEACGCEVSQLKEDLWMEDDTNTSHMMRQQRIRLVWHCSG